MTKFDLKTIELPEAAARPLYAGVGATDLAVEKVKEVVLDVQGKVTAKVAEVQKDVTTRVADVQKTVKGFELPEPKALQTRAIDTVTTGRAQVEKRVADLQADAKAFPARIQSSVKVKVDENVATVTGTYSDLAKRGETVVTKLRTGETPAAAKPAAKKTATSKKAPATKAPAKKAPAKKTTTAKKAPAKKAPAKKATTPAS